MAPDGGEGGGQVFRGAASGWTETTPKVGEGVNKA